MRDLIQQDKIYELQEAMKLMDNVKCDVRHHFSDGLYARELFIPAGVCLVGAMHKTKHLYTVVQGKCKVVSNFESIEIEAPFMGETVPDTKRVIYAITDCVWITYHPTELTDVDEIAKAILKPEDS